MFAEHTRQANEGCDFDFLEGAKAFPSRKSTGRGLTVLSQSKGFFVVAQTTFDDRGALDLDSLDSLIDFYLRHGVDGFTVLGVAGEAHRADAGGSPRGRIALYPALDGKPVIVGVSNPSLRNCPNSRAPSWIAGLPA